MSANVLSVKKDIKHFTLLGNENCDLKIRRQLIHNLKGSKKYGTV